MAGEGNGGSNGVSSSGGGIGNGKDNGGPGGAGPADNPSEKSQNGRGSSATDAAQTSSETSESSGATGTGASKAAIDDDSSSVLPESTLSTVIGGKTVVSVVPERTVIPTVVVSSDGGSDSRALPTSTVVGISVGAGVFSLIFLAFIFFFVKNTRAIRRGTMLHDPPGGESRPSSYSSTATFATSKPMAPVEIDFYGGKPFQFEVSGDSRPMGELPTEPPAAAKAANAEKGARTWPTSVAELPSINYARMSFGSLYDDAAAAGLKTGDVTGTRESRPSSPQRQRGPDHRPQSSGSSVSIAEDDLVLSPATSHGVVDYDVPLSPMTTNAPPTPIIDQFPRRPTVPDITAGEDERPRATFGPL